MHPPTRPMDSPALLNEGDVTVEIERVQVLKLSYQVLGDPVIEEDITRLRRLLVIGG